MGFPRTKKAGNPDANVPRALRRLAVLQRLPIRGKEGAEVLVQLTGDHEFVKFLPDRGGVQLVSFHHTINGAMDIFLEQGRDTHGVTSRNQGERTIVMVVL